MLNPTKSKDLKTLGKNSSSKDKLNNAKFSDEVESLVSKKSEIIPFKTPIVKRVFDIVVSLTVLILLSPLLLLVMVLIKLESPGPVFYISKRVGTGYQVFDFYKLRSMRINADKMLDSLKHLNQYHNQAEVLVKPSREANTYAASRNIDITKEDILVADDLVIDESLHLLKLDENEKNSFFKIKDDPRITKVGHFIRNTSIDELPQLINVLKGDMSIVGNRPLPLYEAEKLTSDDWSLRFIAPAGITGWWQVKDRGKKSISEESRKYLDVEYAAKYSLWMDIKIIFMTIPALFQQTNS